MSLPPTGPRNLRPEDRRPLGHHAHGAGFGLDGFASIAPLDPLRAAAAEPTLDWGAEFALQNLGIDPNTTEELQVTFVSALTSAALSISATGRFDYAWTSFGPVLENGKFFNARKK